MISNQISANQAFGRLFGLIAAFHHFHAACLTASAGVHLGFNHSKFAAQFVECGGSFFAVGGQNPALNRQTIARKQLFCLIFM